MKRQFCKHLFALTLSLLFMSSAVGCGSKNTDSGVEYDPKTVTTLNVQSFDGGYGTEWLEKAAKRFEEAYADHSFEEGKTGVHVDIRKTNEAGTELYSKLATSDNHVIFTEMGSYADFVAANLLLDVTDIVTGAGADGKTIESKLSDGQRDFYTMNQKYYGLPHYSAFYGWAYDIDLFEKKGLYYLTDGTFCQPNKFENGEYTGSGKLAFGPDNIEGTRDDGLPATYDQLFNLCDYMVQRGITPFTWTGAYPDYANWGLCALLADYEGAEQFMLIYNLDGTAKNLVSVSDDGTLTPLGDTAITKQNGYQLYKTAGRYYAYSFMERIIRGHYYSKDAFTTTTTHHDAQDNFLLSCEETTPIAMLADGIYWQNEASDTFKYMETYFDESYGMKTRRLGFLAYPKATEDKVGEKMTLVDSLYSFGGINANIGGNIVEAAKAFLAFCYTDESLQEFTTTVGAPKALNYDLTNEQYDSLSCYSKGVWDYYKAADVIYPVSHNSVFINKQGDFYFRNLLSSASYWLVANELRNDQTLTAAKLFNAMIANKPESAWTATYSMYY